MTLSKYYNWLLIFPRKEEKKISSPTLLKLDNYAHTSHDRSTKHQSFEE